MVIARSWVRNACGARRRIWSAVSGSTPPLAASGLTQDTTSGSAANWVRLPAPTFPAVPLPIRYVAVNAVPLAGNKPLIESPKRRCAVPSVSTSTTNAVSRGPLASRSGTADQVIGGLPS